MQIDHWKKNMMAATVPALFIGVVIYAACKRIDVYESFVESAREGLPLLLRILPYMAAMMIVIKLLNVSGLTSMLTRFLQTPLSYIGMPVELLPLALLRPFSGSAAMAMVMDIFERFGVDSYMGITAATIMGSSETIVYTIALYFGSVGVKKTRFTLTVALAANAVSVIVSLLICKCFIN
jgi:spore maturation protein B